MEKETMREFKRMQEKLNDLGNRIDNRASEMHQSSADQISDLQELAVNNAYEQMLSELGVEG